MTWTVNFATDIGSRSEQQDRCDIVYSNDERRHLVVVADGMGGLKTGRKPGKYWLRLQHSILRFMRRVLRTFF